MNGTEAKAVTDGAVISLTITGMMGWLTPIVAFVSSILGIIWMCIRIYETKTVQNILFGEDNAFNQ
jgi:hypothetical protein